MSLLDLIKKNRKEEPKPILSIDQKRARLNAIRLHKNRINNLIDELKELSISLNIIEADPDVSNTRREKDSDTIIRRMSLIKYEMDIREGLVKWLS